MAIGESRSPSVLLGTTPVHENLTLSANLVPSLFQEHLYFPLKVVVITTSVLFCVSSQAKTSA